MIYLLKSGGYYKIGFAENVEKRMEQYNTHNPSYQLIDITSGTRKDEANLHRILQRYKYKGEWYYPFDEVILVWLDYVNSKEPNITSYDYSGFGCRTESWLSSTIYDIAVKWGLEIEEKEIDKSTIGIREPNTYTIKGTLFTEEVAKLIFSK